jgi:hypothetical protein
MNKRIWILEFIGHLSLVIQILLKIMFSEIDNLIARSIIYIIFYIMHYGFLLYLVFNIIAGSMEKSKFKIYEIINKLISCCPKILGRFKITLID